MVKLCLHSGLIFILNTDLHMNNFRDLKTLDDILGLLDSAPEHEKGQIWQSRPRHREIYEIRKITHDKGQRSIILETLLDFDFSSDYPIYVRINHRDLIFKLMSDNCHIDGNRLICPYPKLAKAIEERRYQRFSLPLGQDFFVLISPLGSAMELKVSLKDFSKKGIGLYISERNRLFFKNNKRFKIVSFNDSVFPGDTFASIRYIKRTPRGLSAGMMFDKILTDSLFQIMTKLALGL